MSDNEIPCQKASPLGRCCCDCVFQMRALKHPWNLNAAKGRISETFGWFCACPDMTDDNNVRQAIFFDGQHGLCEMHEARS